MKPSSRAKRPLRQSSYDSRMEDGTRNWTSSSGRLPTSRSDAAYDDSKAPKPQHARSPTRKPVIIGLMLAVLALVVYGSTRRVEEPKRREAISLHTLDIPLTQVEEGVDYHPEGLFTNQIRKNPQPTDDIVPEKVEDLNHPIVDIVEQKIENSDHQYKVPQDQQSSATLTDNPSEASIKIDETLQFDSLPAFGDGFGDESDVPVEALILDESQKIDRRTLRNESLEMIKYAYDMYKNHAFPLDKLKPVSCTGRNSAGGIAMTALAALETLAITGERQQLSEAVKLIRGVWPALRKSLGKAPVADIGPKALGGLLAAHQLIMQSNLLSDYDGTLLTVSIDIADRLLPAFDTGTGMPLTMVHLGNQTIRLTKDSSAASAASLVVEFGLLSNLTGNPIYKEKAWHGFEALHDMKSDLGFVPSVMDAHTGHPSGKTSYTGTSIGTIANAALRSYLLFGEDRHLEIFRTFYHAAMDHALVSDIQGLYGNLTYIIDVDYKQGKVSQEQQLVWGQSSVWASIAALAGQRHIAEKLHKSWTAAWDRYNWIPKAFDATLKPSRPIYTGYALRGELMEATYLLNDTVVASRLFERLRDHNRARCGCVGVIDVKTALMSDEMPPFFFSGTLQWLYLLFSKATEVTDYYVATTGGHLLAPLKGGGLKQDEVRSDIERAVECQDLCSPVAKPSRVSSSLKHLSLNKESYHLIKMRRCAVCMALSSLGCDDKANAKNNVVLLDGYLNGSTSGEEGGREEEAIEIDVNNNNGTAFEEDSTLGAQRGGDDYLEQMADDIAATDIYETQKIGSVKSGDDVSAAEGEETLGDDFGGIEAV